MAFKPAGSTQPQDENYIKVDWNEINKQVKGGSRPARVSLIVDLGTQEREDFKEEYNETDTKHIKALKEQDAKLTTEADKTFINIPQKPQPQIAVFVDLTSDIVDYGGEIGKQPYRLLLNKSFMGDLAGIGFAGCYSFDKNGQILKDKGFTFHSNSILTKLAKATKQTQIVSGSGKDNMDVSQLLGQPLMVTVDKTETTDGKVYLNYKGCSEVPMIPSDPSDPDSEEVMMTVKPLVSPALAITFDDVTLEQKKWLRGDLIKKIKAANNYEGSKMQEVVEAKSEKQEEDRSGEGEVPDPSSGYEPAVAEEVGSEDPPF